MSEENTQLIPIIGTENPNRTADIIFLHGLGGDALGTWHPQGKKEAKNSWLTWLGDDYKDIGIWSVAYEVEPFRWKGSTMPLADRATNIVDLLDIYEIGERPLIFITHSMGGLVVKQLLRHAYDYGNPSRSILWQQGLIPRNYAHFLDYAQERKLIHKIGGQYRFFHDSLRKYFASQAPIPKRVIQENSLYRVYFGYFLIFAWLYVFLSVTN